MIHVTGDIFLDENELEWEFIRASGPGGQNVNKVSTAVQMRFDVKHSPSLPEEVKHRLTRLAGRRMTREGELVIEARRHRFQQRNRQDALERLLELIRKAAAKPKKRHTTKPTLSSKMKRLESKRLRGDKKKLRQKVRSLE
ncbi:MAG: aminoacyl-tRNA hydrolase [bacterium]|nr:aminoacyl-tRNA hydrolase [bacterium]